MNVKQEFINALNTVFRDNWFKRKWQNWFYQGDLLLKINLQKSTYWEVYYLNTSLYLDSNNTTWLGDLTTRFEVFLPECKLDKEYNFENLSSEDLLLLLENIQHKIISSIDILKSRINYDSLKLFLKNNKSYLVTPKLLTRLEIHE